MVTALLPFLPKTSDPNYTTLTTFDSVKMEGRAPRACGIAGTCLQRRRAPPSMLEHTNQKISSEQSVALRKFQGNLKKSIDIHLQVQLKGAPSLALARSAAGELTTGKNKNRENRKKC